MVETVRRLVLVDKFGGTSLATGEHVKKAVDLSLSPEEGHVQAIVPSAPGLLSKDHPVGVRLEEGINQKVTDMLIKAYQEITDGVSFESATEPAAERFYSVEQSLRCYSVEDWLRHLKSGIDDNGDLHWFKSRGEWGIAKFISAYTGAPFMDATELIRLYHDERIDPITYELFKELQKDTSLFIMPGFYGADNVGHVITFSRGGSDISGAIVARGLNARLYRNWTDTNGIYDISPRLTTGAPNPIVYMTYREARELSYWGFDVMHKDALIPVAEVGIPINVRNSFNPSCQGTTIGPRENLHRTERVIGIAGKGGFTSYTFEKIGMNEEPGIADDLLRVFRFYGVSVDHLATSIDRMTIVAQTPDTVKSLDIIDKLSSLQPTELEIKNNLGIVCIVGEGLSDRKYIVLDKIARTLRRAGIEPRIISSPEGSISITIGVNDQQVKPAISALYKSLIQK